MTHTCTQLIAMKEEQRRGSDREDFSFRLCWQQDETKFLNRTRGSGVVRV